MIICWCLLVLAQGEKKNIQENMSQVEAKDPKALASLIIKNTAERRIAL